MDKAAWANNLLLDPMFKEMMDTLKSEQMTRFLTSNADDVNVREDCYLRINVLDSISNHLQSIAADKLIDKKRFKIF